MRRGSSIVKASGGCRAQSPSLRRRHVLRLRGGGEGGFKYPLERVQYLPSCLSCLPRWWWRRWAGRRVGGGENGQGIALVSGDDDGQGASLVVATTEEEPC